MLCDNVTTQAWRHCLEHGMNVHTEFQNKSNLFTIATTTGNKQLIEILKQYKFDFSKYLMKEYPRDSDTAGSWDKFDFRKYLMKEYQRNSNTTQSPFMILCKYGFIDIFERIDINSTLRSLVYKANSNLRDLNGNSPLHLASFCENATDMIEYLMKNVYADNNQVDDQKSQLSITIHNQLNNKYVCTPFLCI